MNEKTSWLFELIEDARDHPVAAAGCVVALLVGTAVLLFVILVASTGQTYVPFRFRGLFDQPTYIAVFAGMLFDALVIALILGVLVPQRISNAQKKREQRLWEPIRKNVRAELRRTVSSLFTRCSIIIQPLDVEWRAGQAKLEAAATRSAEPQGGSAAKGQVHDSLLNFPVRKDISFDSQKDLERLERMCMTHGHAFDGDLANQVYSILGILKDAQILQRAVVRIGEGIESYLREFPESVDTDEPEGTGLGSAWLFSHVIVDDEREKHVRHNRNTPRGKGLRRRAPALGALDNFPFERALGELVSIRNQLSRFLNAKENEPLRHEDLSEESTRIIGEGCRIVMDLRYLREVTSA